MILPSSGKDGDVPFHMGFMYGVIMVCLSLCK